ncbi:MAG: error-prone DNA polymerase, partial [Mycobacteriaceae bacterium]|nr:error-prone DNA polymerase [Mycobacteriaceae bacterium]
RKFYDLVVEVAIIRPGPIQGGSVHPYIRRRNGVDPVVYDHPSMEPALRKTLGVPLFQEQLMQLAVDCAGFSAAEADQLRRAMGSKRSTERMRRLKGRFYDGMRELHGITGEVADRIYEKLEAFANFGFPESHALSFASLVFYSSWFKLYHPAAFCAALLRAQPMGFYSPQSLVADARRHGVTVHGPDVNASLAHATLENEGTHVRLGIGSVRHIGDELAENIVDERKANGPFTSLLNLTARMQLSVPQTEALATAGALGCFAITRREGLWAAGAAATQRPGRLPGVGSSSHIPALPGMSELELAAADVWATSISPNSYPTQFIREDLDALGVVPADQLLSIPDGTRVLIAGAVTHRQRPGTAGGVTFMNLEDETGMVNVLCTPGVWARHRRLAQTASALLIRGQLQNATGAVTVIAERLGSIKLKVASRSRDFR